MLVSPHTPLPDTASASVTGSRSPGETDTSNPDIDYDVAFRQMLRNLRFTKPSASPQYTDVLSPDRIRVAIAAGLLIASNAVGAMSIARPSPTLQDTIVRVPAGRLGDNPSTETSTEAESTLDVVLDAWLQRLGQFSQLGPDWDSYGGVSPSSLSISTAHRFLVTVGDVLLDVVGSRIQPFNVVPLSYGGVQIEWRGPSYDIEVEVGPNGDFGYLLVDKQGAEETYDEQDDASQSTVLRLVAKALLG